MASNKALNAKNLEALGPKRLAELLIEISTGKSGARRLLRLELAGAEGTPELAREVRHRLTTIGRSRGTLELQKIRELKDDLQILRKVIAGRLATADAVAAFDLIWQYMGIANSTLDRCHDCAGSVVDVFRAAADLGDIARAAGPDPHELADRAFEALTQNAHGQCNGLIGALAPALAQQGLERLKQRMIELSNTPLAQLPEAYRPKPPWPFSEMADEDETADRRRLRIARAALKDIADAQGDVDAFIDQHDDHDRKRPKVATGIACRLLAAGRAEEALKVTEAAEYDDGVNPAWLDYQLEDARIDALDALGRSDEAQELRRSCFEHSLSAPHLRAYLKGFPDFDDIEAEEKALDHVQRFHNRHTALSFLVSWPALDRASALVIEEARDLAGVFHEILTPAADALAARHPLASTLVLRAMIDFTLSQRESARYKHAARHLLECSSLSPAIRDFGTFETHEAYEARLRREYDREPSFWELVA
ncbi:MAG: hypothetical protein OXC14_17200 [Rhodospirillaceae bacterium]|nr:hypothetical protein [Rhodospirillaceae bacterium]